MEPARVFGWQLTTFAYAWLSGVVPVLNCEVYLVWLATNAPRELLWPLVVAATAGQMLAKCLLFWAGRGLLRFPLGRWRRAFEERLPSPAARNATGTVGQAALVFASAFAGFPPFYVLSAAAGALRWSFALFVLCGSAGRLARFSAVMLLPASLLRYAPGPWNLALLLALAALLPPTARALRARAG